eukprot:COSAG02_NODE_55292_length_291_cov_0.812500_1_plen_55_part_10
MIVRHCIAPSASKGIAAILEDGFGWGRVLALCGSPSACVDVGELAHNTARRIYSV